MLDFDKYLSRYGEHVIQALIERIERYDGIRTSALVPLEERWNALMQNAPVQQSLAA